MHAMRKPFWRMWRWEANDYSTVVATPLFALVFHDWARSMIYLNREVRGWSFSLWPYGYWVSYFAYRIVWNRFDYREARA
jgi:hypothetical protein